MSNKNEAITFSEDTLKIAKKNIDYWFNYMTQQTGFGMIQIEFNIHKNLIIIKPTPVIQFSAESENKNK